MKLILIAICLAFGVWYVAIGGKQINEQHVADHYKSYMSAFDKGDGKAVCDFFDKKYEGTFKSTARSMSIKENMTKNDACTSVAEYAEIQQQVAKRVGQEMHSNVSFSIKSIVIAPDKKSASVEALIETRIGTAEKSYYDRRSTQTDTITRNMGNTQFLKSEGSVSFFY